MRDLPVLLVIAFGSALVVAVPGAVLLRRLRRRTVTVLVSVLLVITVLSLLAGIVGTSLTMFLSTHDLTVLLVLVTMSGTVGLTVAVWHGRRLTSEAMWQAELRERERQLEAQRRELVAWVSHDLRTPLAGLQALGEALTDGVVDTPADIDDYHRRILATTRRMTSLVDDLFALSRINAGALRLRMEPVRLTAVVREALSTVEPLARSGDVRLVVEAPDQPVVVGSHPELSRVVVNLMRNAVRFTPSGGRVTVVVDHDTDGAARLTVLDGCGGIPAPDLPRVFDLAFRGEPARTPAGRGEDGGGGLGLAIVDGLVRAHHGEVTVDNTQYGCRFRIRLPSAGAVG